VNTSSVSPASTPGFHRSAQSDSPSGPAGVGRLLPPAGVATWPDHRRHYGPVLPTCTPSLSDLVRASGLRGRGGAGFPTATKIDAVASGGGRTRRSVVVANCCEGDPTARKDRVLIARAPHLVIDGALVAANAVGADRVVFAVHGGSRSAITLRGALAERGAAESAISVVEVPHRFVASEASALVRFLNTGDARPLGRLAPVWESGVDGRPTLVDNAETLAQLALIARFGDRWFRSVGSADEPGTALVTIGGSVPRPGVVEIATGTPILTILAAAGAPPAGWALIGGLAGRWVDLSVVAPTPFTTADLLAAGAVCGVGSIIVLPPGGCLVTETARILHHLADSSARQCGPCMFGLPAIAADMSALAAGDRTALTRLRRRLPTIDRRGACAHPDGAVAVAASAMTVLAGPEAGHLRQHLARRGCRAAAPVVPLGVPNPTVLKSRVFNSTGFNSTGFNSTGAMSR
jgi:NADH:ubiquinone oxidoreductase subunit F (NADH-binding)